jgi:RHS repeat-associated protein
VRTAAATTRTNTTRERLTGFTSDTVLTDATITDPNGNVATVIITLDRVAKKLTAVTNTPQSTINITGVTINGLSQSLNTESISTPTYFYYDALGRPISEKDPLGFVSGRTYDTATGWVTATTNAAGKVTTYQYYQVTEANSGKLKCQTDPNGKKSYTQFNNRGQLKYVWGDVPYPEERVYDDTYGDMIRLRTFRDGSNWSNPSWPGGALTPDETVWTYDPSTGVVLTKQDAAGRAYANTYHPMGILATRQWARGVTITYTLNVFVEPLGKQYSDGTPGFTVSLYTSLGQPYHVIDDAFGTLSFAYDEDGEQLSATYGWDSPLAGVAVTNRINSLYGKDQVAVDLTSGGGSANLLTQYDFDPTTGRLATVSRQVGGTTESVSYSYLANSDLINSRVGKHGTSTAVTANQGWEYGYRLRSTQARLGTSGPLVSSWTYVYDDVDRRQAATLVDGSTWQYGYDDRNQVISGARFWADFVPVAGQQFGYAYDSAGNRGRTTVGGDASGQGLRSSTYTTNNLNQYTSRTVPGAVDVVGYATAPASVTVNGQAAYEKGEYFWKETTVANGSAPQSVQVDVVATQQGNSASDSGRLLVPKATQSFSYDFDGNLTFDGIWQYEWDAENRPKAMTMTNLVGVPNAQRFRLELGYDWLGRRLAKTVKTWTGTEFANPVTTRFVYDLSADQAGGWRLLAELDADNNIVRSYTWGLDLSGTLDDAGGIAGLLFVTQHPGLTTHFACYDGNGNVVALVDTTSTVSARYEYGPFGEPIGLRGAFAETNPIRWSTKYMDAETELVCYGNRYYSPSLGRWISRDPIEEQDGNNLYAYVGNNPVNGIDPLGQLTLAEEETVAGAATTMGFSGGLAQAAGVKAIAAYTVFEISLASYDLYETMDTIVDPDASLDIKTFTVVGAAIGAIAPGGFYSSASKNAGRYLFNTWHKATFDSKLKTIMYHLRIHGKGRTAMQYTQDAMNFFNKNKHLGQKVILKDGTPSIRIQTKLVDPKTGKKIKVGGLWTESGQLVTYWD